MSDVIDLHDIDRANAKIKKLLTPAEREVAKGIAEVVAQTAELVANDYQIWSGEAALQDFAKRLRKMNQQAFA
jgi:hypothetical protein